MSLLISTVLLRPMIPALAAGLVILLMRVRHPASKHAIWASAMMAMLLVPVVSYFAPHWDLPVLPSKSAPAGIVEDAVPATLEFAGDAPVVPSAPVVAAPRRGVRVPLAAWIYLVGLVALSLYRLIGWFLLRRVLARSTPITRRAVRESRDVTSPVAVGVFRPAVLLPLGWRDWSVETRRAVLAHEFAHLRRRDTVISALGRLITSLMWFHPLAWWLAWHVEELAEQACDAVALENVGDPGGYSRILVAFASRVQQRGYRTALPGLAMAAKYSVLARRIDRVFELADGRVKKLAQPGIIAAVIGLPVMCIAAVAGVTAAENLVLPVLRPRLPGAPQVKISAQVRTETAPAIDPNLTFDVASVRALDPVEPNTNGGFRVSGGPGTSDPEHIRFTQASIFQVLTRLLMLQRDQVAGPDWVLQPFGAERFEVIANVKPGATAEQVRVMMLNLLKTRFHLSYHMEKRNLETYELTVAKGGSKLKPAEIPAQLPDGKGPAQAFKGDDGFPNPPPGWPSGIGLVEGSAMDLFFDIKNIYGFRLAPASPVFSSQKPMVWRIGMRMVTIPYLVDWIRAYEGIPHVVDRTGLTGAYDIRLRFSNGAASSDGDAADPAPDIFEAFEKQLGLKLQKSKAPFDVLVIDHIDKTPVEN